MREAEPGEVDERSGTKIIDQRNTPLASKCRKLARGHFRCEALDAIVGCANLENQSLPLRQCLDIVLLVRPVGGTDFDALRAGTRHDIGHAEGTPYLDQLAARYDRLASLGERVEHNENGGGI